MIGFIKDMKNNTNLTDDEIAQLAAAKVADSKPKSRMYYKIGAARVMGGSKKVEPNRFMSFKLQKMKDCLMSGKQLESGEEDELAPGVCLVQWDSLAVAVLEGEGKAVLRLLRLGDTVHTVQVKVDTVDGSAVAGEDYVELHEVVTFQPKETHKDVTVEIIDDVEWEPDEQFFLKVSLGNGFDNSLIKIGKKNMASIMIINDDEPGTFTFDKRCLYVKESCKTATVSVYRFNGADGRVEAKWRTIEGSAKDGEDYEGGEGVIVFQHGELRKDIHINIINNMNAANREEVFRVELFDIHPEGAKKGEIVRTAITVTDDEEYEMILGRMMDLTEHYLSHLSLYRTSWGEQFADAITVNGGDLGSASFKDYVMHVITFGLKLVFATAPPPGKGGGWPCFFVSLFYIGICACVIGDLARVLGCLIGLENTVTAITFITFGTSQIDVFAAKIAAVKDPVADNSIGNVVAANTIGVFLGLGLPWLAAAIYWQVKDPDSGFIVPASGVSFQVMIYMVVCIPGLFLIVIRRFVPGMGKAELGGNTMWKYLTGLFLFLLWILFLVLNILRSYDVVPTLFQE